MNLAQWNKALLALIAGTLTWGAQVVASTPVLPRPRSGY